MKILKRLKAHLLAYHKWDLQTLVNISLLILEQILFCLQVMFIDYFLKLEKERNM